MSTQRRHRVGWIEPSLVVVGFTLLAMLVTWPVAANVTSIIPSPGSAWDPAGYIWDFWQRSIEGLSFWGDSASSLAGVPFTRGVPAAADVTQLVSYGPAWVITHLAGPVVAYNVVIISGLAFSGMAMYGLARWLGAGPGIATWAGGAYVIFPYQLGKAIAHAPLVHLACFPLAVLAGLWWSERPTWRRALVVVAAYAFAWLTNPYYGLMATVVLLIVCGGGLARMAKTAGAAATARAAGLLAGLSALIVLLPVGLIGRSASAETSSGVARSVIDLDNFGARVSDYLIPPANGFLINGFTSTWAGVTANGDERRILYVGLTTIAIAAFGAIVTWRATGASAPRLRLAARTSAVLVVVLAWFSLASPTTWLGVSIPVPSLWIWEAQPQFRVFARFAAPLMCALLILGLLGLRWIAARGGTLWRTSVVAAALIITGADLATTIPTPSAPPVTVAGASPDNVPAWAWLRERETPGAVIQYPTIPEEFTPAGESVERIYAYSQIVHGHPSVNGASFPGQRSFAFLAQVSDPLRPGTPTELATAGVRLVVINPWAYGALGRPATLGARRPPPGFALERTFADGTAIWRVTAKPQAGLVLMPPPGFAWGHAEGGVNWHAIQAPGAVITLWTPTAGRFLVDFPARGLPPGSVSASASGAPVEIVQADGRVGFEIESGPGARDIELRFTGQKSGAALGTARVRSTG